MAAQLPNPNRILELRRVASPHPALLDREHLLQQCETRQQPRSGPGGQHRNRTSSGVFLTYRPAEITAEATEQRSQHRNRDVAVLRLRYLLATTLRTNSPLEAEAQVHELEMELRAQFKGTALKLADTNENKPAVLALVLNDCWIAGGQPSLVAPQWRSSTSRIVSLLRSHPPSLRLTNQIRAHHERPPLH